MYQAINNYIIVQQQTDEITSITGIITTSSTRPRYKVVATTETTKELQDKIVVSDRVLQIDASNFSIDYKDIVAVLV